MFDSSILRSSFYKNVDRNIYAWYKLKTLQCVTTCKNPDIKLPSILTEPTFFYDNISLSQKSQTIFKIIQHDV